ncbi:HAD family hydrolase [Jeotgalibacillus campisalis]|uniref:Phosphoserine phosphatase n=1 Tax=Jeotgalibacillus campisalis TaxID=220754 RepID=A0A0C2S3X0_9BACL|nr:HAD family hydrolase [Jeotgalibacillus campisalis]KIL48684.1 HAD hydrolase, family IA, variant 1 [Jeotgalibacillus campisalis]
MPKAIFFDLDDTLLWDKKSIEEALMLTAQQAMEIYQVDAERLIADVREIAPAVYSSLSTHSFTQLIGINPFEGLWGEFGDPIHHMFREMGDIMPEYRKQVWTKALKKQEVFNKEFGYELAQRFIENRKRTPVVYEETFAVLDEFKEQGMRMLLLTNGAPSLQLEKLKLTPELVPYFEHIVISGNVGFGKPNAEIFNHSLRLMDLLAEDVWMVGDNKKTDILGANRANIQSVWIQHDDLDEKRSEKDGNPDTTINRLKQLLTLVKNN